MAHKIEDLPIYQKVVDFWSAVNSLLAKPQVRRDRDLHDQIARANNSIPANMVEGFEQGSDRSFAHFVTHAKGSLAEVLARLKQAYFKHYITADELNARLAAGEELGKMLGGFIKYLRKCSWTDRGSHDSTIQRFKDERFKDSR
ncbi:MAG: four helix bundle protein [Acidobacteriota bacterium]